MAFQCINLGLGLGFGIDLSLCGVLDGGVGLGLGLGVKPLCLGVKQLSGWADSCPPFIVHYLHFNSIHHHSFGTTAHQQKRVSRNDVTLVDEGTNWVQAGQGFSKLPKQ